MPRTASSFPSPTGLRLIFLNRYFHPDVSATSQLASDLVFALAAQGCDITVISSAQRYDDPHAALPAREQHAGVRILRVGVTRFGRNRIAGRLLDYGGYFIGACVALWRVARRGTVVIAMSDPPLLGVPAGWICRRRHALLVQWCQDVLPEVAVAMGALRPGRLARALQALRDRSLRASARVVTISDRMAARLTQAAGRPVDVIPNWALEEASASEAERAALRAEWRLGSSPVIGYAGNMGRAHRLTELLDAAALLRADCAMQWLFVGGGAQRAALAAQAARLQLDNVHFQPYQPRTRLAAMLGAADLQVVSLDPALDGLILPSKFVGLLALGRPVLWLGDPEGEVGRLVRDWQCGLCVAPGDPAALATALRALFAAESAGQAPLRRMGERARALWAERFRRDDALAAWSRVLREVAA